jgi:hypothetical protein
MMLLPIAVLGHTAALYSLSFYSLIPLLPFVALGMAALLRYGLPRMAAAAAAVVCAAVVVGPLVTSTMLTIDRAEGDFGTVIDPLLLNPRDTRSVAGWVNAHAQPQDVVIASPGLAWLVDANVADFQMAVAADGAPTAHLPANIPSERWAFDPRLDAVRYVIVDNLWRNWAVPNMPAVARLLRRVERWPRMFASGQIEVYQNPAGR